jgi:cyclopropane-fatty-acyl-phospholipid synthase
MSATATSSSDLSTTRSTPALRAKADELLAKADILANGSRPWDMRLNRAGVLERIAARGSLGLGETYVDGEWDAESLDEFFTHLLRARLDREARPLNLLLPILRERLFNRQNSRRAWQVGEVHYDLGNDFYQAMLGSHMAYSCGYWKQAASLDSAQEAKLDLICRKLRLEPGMRVLDIGCGWGVFMAYAAENFGVECVGVTVSKNQAAFASQHYPGLPLEFRLQDYRDLDGKFDRIVSIGMFEHAGLAVGSNQKRDPGRLSAGGVAAVAEESVFNKKPRGTSSKSRPPR